jgi:hypothetical protein
MHIHMEAYTHTHIHTYICRLICLYWYRKLSDLTGLDQGSCVGHHHLCVHMHVCVNLLPFGCRYVHVYVHVHSLNKIPIPGRCIRILYVCIYIRIYIYIYICINAHAHKHIHKFAHAEKWVHAHICIDTKPRMHIFTNVMSLCEAHTMHTFAHRYAHPHMQMHTCVGVLMLFY